MPAKVTTIIVASAVLLLAGLVWYGSKSGSVTSGNAIGEYHKSQGAGHVAEGTKVEYKTNPPTSGDHYADAVDWGIYDKELPAERLVHNLEHGGVNLFYHPDKVNESEINELKKLASVYKSKVILAPRAQNEHKISLASWEHLLNLDEVDKNKIASFLKNNRNKAPEFIPD